MNENDRLTAERAAALDAARKAGDAVGIAVGDCVPPGLRTLAGSLYVRGKRPELVAAFVAACEALAKLDAGGC